MSQRNLRPQPSQDLGRATCSLRSSVAAGSYQVCTLTYTAGFAGIDDTGSLKFVMRFASDAGTPQFNDPQAPNYVTASASNGAQLQLRYDVKDNVCPLERNGLCQGPSGLSTGGRAHHGHAR